MNPATTGTWSDGQAAKPTAANPLFSRLRYAVLMVQLLSGGGPGENDEERGGDGHEGQGFVTSRQIFVRRCQCVWHGLKSSRRGARLARLWPARQSPEVPAMPDHVSNSVWCSLSPTGHPNRGIDRVFETVSVVGRGLVSIAEVHAIIARAHLAKSEPEMTSDRFGFSERHGFVKLSSGSTSKATGHSGSKSTPCR